MSTLFCTQARASNTSTPAHSFTHSPPPQPPPPHPTPPPPHKTQASQAALDAWRQSPRLLERRQTEGWQWVRETLAASTADWLVVAGHFPVYSAGACVRALVVFFFLGGGGDTPTPHTLPLQLTRHHHPTTTLKKGDHGDTPELKRHLKPLLERYGVDAYLCGHDHVLEYMKDGSAQVGTNLGGGCRPFPAHARAGAHKPAS